MQMEILELTENKTKTRKTWDFVFACGSGKKKLKKIDSLRSTIELNLRER